MDKNNALKLFLLKNDKKSPLEINFIFFLELCKLQAETVAHTTGRELLGVDTKRGVDLLEKPNKI